MQPQGFVWGPEFRDYPLADKAWHSTTAITLPIQFPTWFTMPIDILDCMAALALVLAWPLHKSTRRKPTVERWCWCLAVLIWQQTPGPKTPSFRPPMEDLSLSRCGLWAASFQVISTVMAQPDLRRSSGIQELQPNQAQVDKLHGQLLLALCCDQQSGIPNLAAFWQNTVAWNQ